MLGIFPGLDRVAISLRDVVAALIGSLLVLAGIGYISALAGHLGRLAVEDPLDDAGLEVEAELVLCCPCWLAAAYSVVSQPKPALSTRSTSVGVHPRIGGVGQARSLA